MPTATITINKPKSLQMKIMQDEARFRVVACGRRFGKTSIATHECILRLLRQQHIWYCTPTYTLAKQVFESLVKILRGIPSIYINRSDLKIKLGDGAIKCVSVDQPDNLRGAGVDFVVMDEAAFMRDGVWDSVLRPMLATSKGDALFISSPYGRNWFWTLYTQGLDPLQQQWNSHHYNSADGGLIEASELEDIRLSTPERIFREEYLAEFLEDSGAVFRGVDDAVRLYGAQYPIAGHHYVFGVDWGKSNDYTAIVVIDATTQNVVHVDRFNQIGWTLQRGRLAQLYATWKPDIIIAESNSIGSVNIEALQREGMFVEPFETTAQSKSPLIEGLALAVERGDIGLLDDPVLLNEMKAYELERMVSGRYRYSAPSGGHDDTVIATALSWRGASEYMMQIALI